MRALWRPSECASPITSRTGGSSRRTTEQSPAVTRAHRLDHRRVGGAQQDLVCCRQVVQELDEQVAAHRVRREQRFVEQERRALATSAEHLAEREPQQQRHLVAGAVRHRVERHHVRALATEQAEREVVGVDVHLDVARARQQAEPAAERLGEPRGDLAMGHA